MILLQELHDRTEKATLAVYKDPHTLMVQKRLRPKYIVWIMNFPMHLLNSLK